MRGRGNQLIEVKRKSAAVKELQSETGCFLVKFHNLFDKRNVNSASAIFSFINLFLNMQRGQTHPLLRYSFACLLTGWRQDLFITGLNLRVINGGLR